MTSDSEGFFSWASKHAKRAGRAVLEPAAKLYYAAIDSDTPLPIKTTIFGGLAYLVSPIDAIPDFLPGGYVDDIGVLATASLMAAAYIKEEHVKRAAATVRLWLGDDF